MEVKAIIEFRGKYGFLSGMYDCPVVYDGLEYKNAEAAYHSAKTINIELRKCFCELDGVTSKKLADTLRIRDDWDKIKDKVMEDVLRDKFTRNIDLRKKLIETYPKIIIHGNDHKDTYWGIYKNKGKNKMGFMLMSLRDELMPKKVKW